MQMRADVKNGGQYLRIVGGEFAQPLPYYCCSGLLKAHKYFRLSLQTS